MSAAMMCDLAERPLNEKHAKCGVATGMATIAHCSAESLSPRKTPAGRIRSLPRHEMSVPHIDLAVLFCREEHLLGVRETTPLLDDCRKSSAQ
jgi:hypothetical protein